MLQGYLAAQSHAKDQLSHEMLIQNSTRLMRDARQKKQFVTDDFLMFTQKP